MFFFIAPIRERYSQNSSIFRILWHVHAISELHHQYDSRQEGHSPRHGTLFWSEVLLCFFLPLGFFGDVNLKFTPLKKLTWNTKIGGVVSDSMFLLFSFDMLLISHLIAISNDFGHPHMKKNKI